MAEQQDTTLLQDVDNSIIRKDPDVESTGAGPAPARKRRCASCLGVLFSPATRRQVIVCIVFWVVLVVGILALVVWLLPKIVVNGIVPLTEKLRKALTPVQVGALLAGLLIVMPLVFLPPYPFIWLCAPLLGIWPCFAVVEVSTAVGMLLAFTLGRTTMHKKAEQWANKKEGLRTVFNALDRVGPFKTLVLLRLSPAPYALINYCAAVPPAVSVQSFMVASVVALIPRHFLWVYFGRHLKGLAAFLTGKPMPASQVVYNVVVLVVALVIVIGAAIFATRVLRRIRREGAQAAAGEDPTDPEAQKGSPLPHSSSSTSGSLAAGQASGSDHGSATDGTAAVACVLEEAGAGQRATPVAVPPASRH